MTTIRTIALWPFRFRQRRYARQTRQLDGLMQLVEEARERGDVRDGTIHIDDDAFAALYPRSRWPWVRWWQDRQDWPEFR